MVEVSRHPRIKLLTYHEVDSISGFVGNFKVKVKRKPRYIDEDLCVGCLECIEACVFKKGKVREIERNIPQFRRFVILIQ
jgi:heterodisulfide reductase subunit A